MLVDEFKVPHNSRGDQDNCFVFSKKIIDKECYRYSDPSKYEQSRAKEKYSQRKRNHIQKRKEYRKKVDKNEISWEERKLFKRVRDRKRDMT